MQVVLLAMSSFIFGIMISPFQPNMSIKTQYYKPPEPRAGGIPVPILNNNPDMCKVKGYLLTSNLGRFGNHISQYATLYGLAKKLQVPSAISELHHNDLVQLFPNISLPVYTHSGNTGSRNTTKNRGVVIRPKTEDCNKTKNK
jgi:hypothetical protein